MSDTGLFNPLDYTEEFNLADRFLVPPFSTLDTRSPRWAELGQRWAHLPDDGHDPVTWELAYRWWTPADGTIIAVGGAWPDTAARVAATMGRTPAPRRECDAFIGAYGKDNPPATGTIDDAAKHLRNHRFAIATISNHRRTNGTLINYVGRTIAAHEAAGLDYYNGLIRILPTPPHDPRFAGTRQPPVTHDHIAVFVKGDWRKAAAAAEQGAGPQDQAPQEA